MYIERIKKPWFVIGAVVVILLVVGIGIMYSANRNKSGSKKSQLQESGVTSSGLYTNKDYGFSFTVGSCGKNDICLAHSDVVHVRFVSVFIGATENQNNLSAYVQYVGGNQPGLVSTATTLDGQPAIMIVAHTLDHAAPVLHLVSVTDTSKKINLVFFTNSRAIVALRNGRAVILYSQFNDLKIRKTFNEIQSTWKFHS